MQGVQLLKLNPKPDSRGSFIKLVTSSGISMPGGFALHESFITRSNPGVVRGLHLQVGQAANFRLIHVVDGSVFDVLLDLRGGSETRNEIATFNLSSSEPSCLLVPPGVAHGFQALTQTTMLYLTTSGWSENDDTGVNPRSLDIEWPLPITEISARDKELPSLHEFNRYV